MSKPYRVQLLFKGSIFVGLMPHGAPVKPELTGIEMIEFSEYLKYKQAYEDAAKKLKALEADVDEEEEEDDYGGMG